MDLVKTKSYTFNYNLANIIGLNLILNSKTIKILGYKVNHIIIILFLLAFLTITVTCSIGLYYFRNDIFISFLFIGYISNHAFVSYKIMNIKYNSRDLWKIINISSLDFMAYKHYNRNVFEKWKKLSIRVTYLQTFMSLFALIVWGFSAILLKNEILTIKNINGSIQRFRMNISNLCIFLSSDTYNDNFSIFYLLEILILICYLYCILIFDIVMISICLALSCDLDLISKAIESLGYISHSPTTSKYSLVHMMSVYYNIITMKLMFKHSMCIQ